MSITNFAAPTQPFVNGLIVLPNVYWVRDQLVFVATSDATTNTGFKYYFRLLDSGANEIHKSYVTANPADVGMFNVSPIIRNRLSLPSDQIDNDQASIHKGGTDDLLKVDGAAKIFRLIPGEVYESSGTLTEFPDTGDQIFFMALHGTGKLYQSNPNTGQQFMSAFATVRPSAESGVKGFLSNIEQDTYSHIYRAEELKSKTGAKYAVPMPQGAGPKPSEVVGRVAWIHDSTYFDGTSDELTAKFYDEDDNLLYTYTVDTTDPNNGGQALNSSDEDGKVLSFPAFEGAIKTIAEINSNTSGYDYYTIQLTGQPTFSPPESWVFFKHREDCRFKRFTVAWDNGVGFYDYYTFILKAENTKKVEAKNYSTNLGTWTESSFNRTGFNRNTKTYTIKEEKLWKLSTGKIPEATALYLSHILSARKIDLIDEDLKVLPVTLEDTTFSFNENMSNTMREYTFTFKLAQYIEA